MRPMSETHPLPPSFVPNVVQQKPPNASGYSEWYITVHQTIGGMPEYISASFEEHRLALYSDQLRKDWWNVPEYREDAGKIEAPEESLTHPNVMQVTGHESARHPHWMVCCTPNESQSFEERRLTYYTKAKEARPEPPLWAITTFRSKPDDNKSIHPEQG